MQLKALGVEVIHRPSSCTSNSKVDENQVLHIVTSEDRIENLESRVIRVLFWYICGVFFFSHRTVGVTLRLFHDNDIASWCRDW